MKKILGALLLVLLLVCVFSVVSHADPIYNATVAVNYAVAHWNDGVGLCDGFVKACLSAGGIHISSSYVTYVYNELLNYGTSYQLVFRNGVCYESDNRGHVAPGDIIFWRCQGCADHGFPRPFAHTAIINSIDSNGAVRFCAHNAAEYNSVLTNGFSHICAVEGHNETHSGSQIQYYVIHIPSINVQAPTSATLSIGSKDAFEVNEVITFTCSANVNCNYVLHVGREIDGEPKTFSTTGSYQKSFGITGTYKAWVTASNSSGSCTSNVITFDVMYKVSNVTLSIDKTVIMSGDTPVFTYSAPHATTIQLYYFGKNDPKNNSGHYDLDPAKNTFSPRFFIADEYSFNVVANNKISVGVWGTDVHLTVEPAREINKANLTVDKTTFYTGDSPVFTIDTENAHYTYLYMIHQDDLSHNITEVVTGQTTASLQVTYPGVYKCYFTSGNYTYTKSSNEIYITVLEDEGPVIRNINVSDVMGHGFWLAFDVDNHTPVQQVLIRAGRKYSENEFIDEYDYYGDTIGHVSLFISSANHNCANDCDYLVSISATDITGRTKNEKLTVYVPYWDMEAPTLDNIVVDDLTSRGFTVSFETKDNIGIKRACVGVRSDNVFLSFTDCEISDGTATAYISSEDYNNLSGCTVDVVCRSTDEEGNETEKTVAIEIPAYTDMDDPDFILPENLTIIEANAFEGIDAEVIYIPDGCEYIDDYAFRDCFNLRQIRIPEDCEIGMDVFDDCIDILVFSAIGSPAEEYCDDHDNCTLIEE